MSIRRPARPRLTRAKLRRLVDAIDNVRACVDLGTTDRRRLADAGLIAAGYLERMDQRTKAAAAAELVRTGRGRRVVRAGVARVELVDEAGR